MADSPGPRAPLCPDIVFLFDGCHALSTNPVYLPNRAVVLSYAQSPQAALDALTPLVNTLGDYQPFYAAQADVLRRLGRSDESYQAYQRAIDLSHNYSERAFLQSRLATLSK